jgi:hypothetical protein
LAFFLTIFWKGDFQMENLRNNIDSVESAKIDEELSGSPDDMTDDVSNADSADTDICKSDHSEKGADPAEDTAVSSKEAADENGTITNGESTTPAETESEPETAVKVSQPQEPFSESLTFMGLDSTAMTDIAFIEVEDKDERDNSMAEWINEIAEPKDGQNPHEEKFNKTHNIFVSGRIKKFKENEYYFVT